MRAAALGAGAVGLHPPRTSSLRCAHPRLRQGQQLQCALRHLERVQSTCKQATSRLLYIAEQVLVMPADLYHDPDRVRDDIPSLGLRHVGWQIPTELLGPFVSCVIDLVMELDPDTEVVESFRWGLGIVSGIMVRIITEGNTVVMKAISLNSLREFKKAIDRAPRGARAHHQDGSERFDSR